MNFLEEMKVSRKCTLVMKSRICIVQSGICKFSVAFFDIVLWHLVTPHLLKRTKFYPEQAYTVSGHKIYRLFNIQANVKYIVEASSPYARRDPYE